MDVVLDTLDLFEDLPPLRDDLVQLCIHFSQEIQVRIVMRAPKISSNSSGISTPGINPIKLRAVPVAASPMPS
ncbi:hypothetical protein [Methylobacterium marchantiae]|uniref:Uncharacterized protein n=1 Tax=Methylobacterium marchantiae TaxID=600331 RepID=A0ABW3X1U6_9HYPH|nr:hypothetical protein AIGOOFII_3225 [Methylobacterium marchantiae]